MHQESSVWVSNASIYYLIIIRIRIGSSVSFLFDSVPPKSIGERLFIIVDPKHCYYCVIIFVFVVIIMDDRPR